MADASVQRPRRPENEYGHYRVLSTSMKISGTHSSHDLATATGSVRVIDQSRLPFEFATVDLAILDDAARAIKTSAIVRGAPLIGATAAYGLALAVRFRTCPTLIDHASRTLAPTRPTAHNLAWALARMRRALAETAPAGTRGGGIPRGCPHLRTMWNSAGRLASWARAPSPGRRAICPPLNVLTHCNAVGSRAWTSDCARPRLHGFRRRHPDPRLGWMKRGLRNQGALTAFELGAHGVYLLVIADNLGGHLYATAP